MRLVVVLAIICTVSALLLAGTYTITKDKIAAQMAKEEEEALRIVLPDAECFEKKEVDGFEYYEGKDGAGRLVGYAFVNEGKGYSSTIKIMIGLAPDETITGIKILSQNETPGLGDRVDEVKIEGTLWHKLKGKEILPPGRPWFQAQFTGKKVETLETLDTIDAITGATITTNAVKKIIKEGIEKFKTRCQRKESGVKRQDISEGKFVGRSKRKFV